MKWKQWPCYLTYSRTQRMKTENGYISGVRSAVKVAKVVLQRWEDMGRRRGIPWEALLPRFNDDFLVCGGVRLWMCAFLPIGEEGLEALLPRLLLLLLVGKSAVEEYVRSMLFHFSTDKKESRLRCASWRRKICDSTEKKKKKRKRKEFRMSKQWYDSM